MRARALTGAIRARSRHRLPSRTFANGATAYHLRYGQRERMKGVPILTSLIADTRAIGRAVLRSRSHRTPLGGQIRPRGVSHRYFAHRKPTVGVR